MPLYDYECSPCTEEWEATHTIDNRKEEYCTVCGDQAQMIISTASRPVTYEYYSEQLDGVVTGPKQKKQLAKSKGLEEY